MDPPAREPWDPSAPSTTRACQSGTAILAESLHSFKTTFGDFLKLICPSGRCVSYGGFWGRTAKAFHLPMDSFHHCSLHCPLELRQEEEDGRLRLLHKENYAQDPAERHEVTHEGSKTNPNAVPFASPAVRVLFGASMVTPAQKYEVDAWRACQNLRDIWSTRKDHLEEDPQATKFQHIMFVINTPQQRPAAR